MNRIDWAKRGMMYRRRIQDAVSFEVACIAAGLLGAHLVLPLVFLALRWWGV